MDANRIAGRSVDFVLEVYAEKIEGAGEDSYLYVLADKAALVGVFDGCGGSGARGYARAQGRTGAYLASRIMSGATRDWFEAGEATGDIEDAARRLASRTKRYLSTCASALAEGSRMKGTLAKELPTTCALELLAGDGREGFCLWAGDSRCYVLDAAGLHQLTTDDVEGYDPLENLRADGVLTNVVSAAGDFELHVAPLRADDPCVVFAATDGCFGYLSTPMEFEHLLLSALEQAATPLEWERRLASAFTDVAGDDATLCGVSVGFGGFAQLKESLAPRALELRERYVVPLAGAPDERRVALWQDYRKGYLR